MTRSRSLALLAASWMAALVASCSAGPSHDIVCYPAGSEGPTPRQCVVAAATAVQALGEGREPVLVAIHAFRGCPPGAFCGFNMTPGPPPLSALVGVRFGDGSSALGHIDDLAVRSPVVTSTTGYGPDEFIDGVARSKGTLWP